LGPLLPQPGYVRMTRVWNRARPLRVSFGALVTTSAALSLFASACSILTIQTPEVPPSPPRPLALEAAASHRSRLDLTFPIDLAPVLKDLTDARPPPSPAGDAPTATQGTSGGKAPPQGWEELEARLSLRAVARRTSLSLTLEGATLRARALLELSTAAKVATPRWRAPALRACGCRGEAWCGATKQRAQRAEATWEVELRVDDTLHLAPKLRALPALKLLDPCDLGRDSSGAPIDGSVASLRAVRREVEATAARVDRALSTSTAVRDAVGDVWRRLDTSTDVVPGAIWLDLRPSALAVGHVRGHRTTLQIPVSFALVPTLTERRHDHATARALPTVSREIDASGLRVVWLAALPTTWASAVLRERLVGRIFPERGGRRSVTIRNVAVYGSAGRAVVRLDFEGAARTSIYVVGRIAVDPLTMTASLEDVTIDEGSMSTIRMLYDDIEQIDLHRRRVHWIQPARVKQIVGRAARWPVLPTALDLPARIRGALSTSLGSLGEGDAAPSVEDVRFERVGIDAEAIRVLVTISAGIGEDGKVELPRPVRTSP
jgi:hypothetical protein